MYSYKRWRTINSQVAWGNIDSESYMWECLPLGQSYFYYYIIILIYPESYWPFTFWPSIFPWHLLLLLSTEIFLMCVTLNSVLRDIMPSLFWARIVCWLCLGWILVFTVGFPENRLCCPNCSLGLAIGFDMTAGGGRCHDPYLNCHFF